MFFLLKLSFRNVMRNPGRTFITSVAVVVGVALMILGWGLVDGLDENFLRASSQTVTGDVLLRPDDYPTDGTTLPLDKAKIPPDLQEKLAKIGPMAPRVQFYGRLVQGADAARVMGIAYDPQLDPQVFERKNWQLEGAWPADGKEETVVGDRLATQLHLKLGDSVVMEARTMAGAMNALTYVIVGIVHTDNAMVDSMSMWLPMPIAENLLLLEGKRTQLAVKVEHGTPEEAKEALASAGWQLHTVREECADMLELNTVRRRGITFLVFVIMAIAATGITNSVLMSAFERVREIGALRALGMTRGGVAAMFAFEGMAMGIGAATLGAIIGVSAVLYWQDEGIVLGEQVMGATSSMAMSAHIYTHFGWAPTIGSVLFALVIAQLAALYPMYFATQLNPADAVRSE